MRIRRVWIERNDIPETGARFLEPALRLQDVAKAEVCVDVVRVMRYGIPVTRERLVKLALRLE